MNIAQTRQVMAYIWATHPSAPKYTDDDKVRTVASYFRVLYKYAIDDVMDAVDRFCHESPTFIPSAYEIEARCEKHVDISQFLPTEYFGLDRQLEVANAKRQAFEPQYDQAFKRRAEILNGVVYSMLPKNQREELDSQLAPLEVVICQYHTLCDECWQLKGHMEEIYRRATQDAFDAYDHTQAQLAHNDLCSLGFERLALEG